MSEVSQPVALAFTSPSPTSVRVSWRAQESAVGYEVRSVSAVVRRVMTNSVLLKGYGIADKALVQVRAIDRNGTRSNWSDIDVRTTVGVSAAPLNFGVVPVLDADRQSMRLRVNDVDGNLIEVLLYLWWHPSDAGWWGSIEAPVNNPIVSSRRLGTNIGILDGMEGILAGNFVIRTTALGGVSEPDRQSFVDGTHQLRWEPLA